MKTAFLLFSTLLVLTFSPRAQAASYEFEETITKDFDVRPDVELLATASFSEIAIESWDENTVEVSIDINFEARNEEKAKELRDKIRTDIEGSFDHVRISTGLDGSWNKDAHELEIKVLIKAPENSKLNATSEFGTLNVNNFGNDVVIECSFGKMHLTNLSGEANRVTSEYSSGSLSGFGGGEIDVEFGSLEVEQLSGKIEFNASYSAIEILRLDNNVTRLALENEFGSCDLSVLRSASFNIEAASEFGKLDLDGSIKINNRDKEMTSLEISAQIGDPTDNQITINTSFGDVNVNLD